MSSIFDAMGRRRSSDDAESAVEGPPERYEFVAREAEAREQHEQRVSPLAALRPRKGSTMADNAVDTTIGSNVKIEGNLKNMGSIEVNGEVDGEIHSEQNVVIGQTAKIKGPILAKNVTVSGEVNGPVEALERLEITASGRLHGDIAAQLLVIQQGAYFVGKSAMREDTRKITAPAMPTEEPVREHSADEALTALLGEEEEEGDLLATSQEE